MDVPAAPSPSTPHVPSWQAGHVAFQILLRATPSRLKGCGPQQLCWANRQSQVPLQTPRTLRSSISVPLLRKACPPALFYEEGEIRGLEHHPWWITLHQLIFPRSDIVRLLWKRPCAGPTRLQCILGKIIRRGALVTRSARPTGNPASHAPKSL